MSSAMDLMTQVEVQELEINDLRREIASLREIIQIKNSESGKMKMTIRTQEIKLSSLQRLAESYTTKVKNILSPDQMMTPSDSELTASRWDTSSDLSVSSPLFIPREGTTSFEFQPPHQSTVMAPQPPHSSPYPVPHHDHNYLAPQSTSPREEPTQPSADDESSSIPIKVLPVRSASIAKPKPHSLFTSNPTKLKLSSVQDQEDGTDKLSRRKFSTLKLHLTSQHKGKPIPMNLSTLKCHLCKRNVRKENEAKHMEKVHKDESSDSEYEVEKVLSYRKDQGKMVYQVRWRLGDTTWEPIENLTNCQDKIEEFWKEKKAASSDQSLVGRSKDSKKIKFKMQSLERKPSGESVPAVKMLVKETTSVKRVKVKYARTLKVKVEQLQLMMKDRVMEDRERVKGLQGEVLTVKGLDWL